MVKIKVKVEENRSIGEDRSYKRDEKRENGEEDRKNNDARLAHGENMLFCVMLHKYILYTVRKRGK